MADHRAQGGGRVQRVARLVQDPSAFDKARHKAVVNRAVHQQARARVADLARVVKNATYGAVHRGVKVIQVGHENLRTFAPGLQRHALHIALAGITQQQLAHGSGTGECDFGYVHVQAQCFPCLGADAVDHVEHTCRSTGVHKQLRQARAA